MPMGMERLRGIVKGYGASLGGNKNSLKLICGDGCKLCEYTKSY